MKFGVFDSGIGGVTVLQALRRQFPGERFAYFGDTAHVPYGTKSPAQIRALSASAAARIRAHGVDALVVACNTASSLALPEIEEALGSVPVYGMVEAGVHATRQAHLAAPGPIVVFGTRATVRSGVCGERLRAVLRPTPEVFERACPLLVPLIEEGWIDHPVLELTLQEYVAPYRDRAPGVALLACTHYPWIRGAFARALPGWTIIDSADAVAGRLREEQGRLGLEAVSAGGPNGDAAAPVEWFFSDPEVADFIFTDDVSRPEIRGF